ncbi:MAG: 50S ribosomal protein L1 [Nanoarchaeota archaeon]|nr:50S ribosomal protein L1 [Nanoarchaeota archaeon]
MDKNQVIDALRKVKENSPKRNFKQSYDLIITLSGLNLKKPDNQVDVFASLHYDRGKKAKVCALVGPELKAQAKEACNAVVDIDDFDKYQKDVKLTKKLANDNDFFIAQANIMPKVAGAFGRVLGPKGKMPNPKAGCIVPPNANLKVLIDKLQKTVRISVKISPMLQCRIGNEESKDEEVVDNVMTIYNTLIHALPNEAHNIRSVYLKLTMGSSVKVGEKEKENAEEKKPKVEKKAEEAAKKVKEKSVDNPNEEKKANVKEKPKEEKVPKKAEEKKG